MEKLPEKLHIVDYKEYNLEKEHPDLIYFQNPNDFYDYTVTVQFSISGDTLLPKDSTVAIVGDGLMGDKFVKIEPGKSKEYLKDGDKFQHTKDFKTLEDMVGEIIFMVTDSGEKYD